jgi:hypothetical protein
MKSMVKETIRSITDKEWASENELGTIEEIIEYSNGEQLMKVKAVAHVISGAELDAIEAKFTSFDMDTGKMSFNSEGMNKAKMCRVFRLDEKTYDQIFTNKSSDLRLKMMVLMNRVTGAVQSKKEIDKEKNSPSPGA